jgi:transcriptional regulator with GAF, ATPase, and Fis domain
MQDKGFYVNLWETIKGGKNWEGVMIDRKKDGSLFTEEMTITPLMDERKRILHFIAIIQDISEREQREKELTVIANVSYALRNTQTRAEMYPAILNQLLEQLNMEAATIDLLDPITDEMVVELGRGLWANATGLRIPPGQGLSRKVMDSGKAYVNNNNYVSPETYYKDIFGNCLASAAIPLSVRDQKIGTIFIGANRKIDVRDIRLLKSVADIAASAINRAFLYEKTQEKVRQLDSLRVIDQAISTSFDLNVTLNVILKQSQEMLGCDALTVLLSKPQTMMLENAANLGFQSDEIKRLISILVMVWQDNQSWSEGLSVWIYATAQLFHRKRNSLSRKDSSLFTRLH